MQGPQQCQCSIALLPGAPAAMMAACTAEADKIFHSSPQPCSSPQCACLLPQVALVAFDLQGPAVRKMLPRDINPKIKEQLDAAFGDAGLPAAPAAPPAAAAAAPTPQTAKGKAAGGGGAGSTPKARQGAATPVVAHAKTGKAQQQSSRPSAAAAVPPPPAQSFAPDDPTPFLQELRAKEQQYGRSHPAVAEACSNLAILYNQRGDYKQAQPLYERALSIYEANFGPDHSDVAHTLTDLAVLHLEQVGAGAAGGGAPLQRVL